MAEEDKKKEDTETEATEGASQPIYKQKKFIMIAAALVLIMGGAGGYFFMMKPKAVQDEKVTKAIFMDLPEMTVNLNAGDRPLYLKLKVSLELKDAKMIEQITPVMPRVLDGLQTFLRQMRPSDVEGSVGIYRVKEELHRRISEAIAPTQVEAVLFKEFVVQ